MPHSASALLNRLLARGKFRHVQVLLQLAELGSVQRTADAIGMTQSSVTQTLAYLENLLEVKLFDRHARGVRPTAACADLLPVARQLMMGVADSAEIIAARQKQGGGVVRMVASAAAINGLLVDALPQFTRAAPGIQVQLREAEGEDQLLAIARGEVDLVACRRPPVIPAGWEFHAIRDDRFAIICRADNPLARARGKVAWTDLAEHAWLLLPTGLAARSRFDQLAQQFPHPPLTYPVVTRALPMVVWLLRQENLLSLLPLNLARPLIESGLLAEVRTAHLGPMEALGVLQPAGGRAEATERMSQFLRKRRTGEPLA